MAGKPRKKSAYARQKQEAAGLYKERPPGARLVPTFSYPKSAYHAAIQRFSRRRVPVPWVLEMLKSRDPVIRRIAAETVATVKPSLLARHLDKAKMGKIIRDAPEPAKSAVFRLLERKKDKEKWAARGKRAAGEFESPGKRGRKLLLAERMPAMATPHSKSLLRKAKEINRICTSLRKKYKGSFVGVVVRGSTAKGYMKPGSDLDCVVIAYDHRAADEFVKMAKEKNISFEQRHVESHLFLNPEMVPEKIRPFVLNYLFSGIFFGNRARLERLQREAFEHMTPEEWSQLRERAIEKDSAVDGYYDKAFKRFGITDQNEQRRLIAAFGYRVPPPYDEMKKIMQKRKRKKN